MTYKVILPASQIPLDAKVTRLNGMKEYCLKNRIRIIYEDKTQIIPAENGAKFLVSFSYDVNIINGTQELVWLVEEEELIRHINGDDYNG